MGTKKVILITGTSRGIGKYMLEVLRKNPAYIVYGSSRHMVSTDTFHIAFDVTDERSCRRAVEKILSEQGRLDVLINNAGSHLIGASEETSIEEIKAQMQLNFFGSVNMMKAVTPVYLDQKSGQIINMSSLGGLLSLPFTSAYNASKFALEGYSESLRLELLPFGIFISNLEPAYINSGTPDQSIIATGYDHPFFSTFRHKMHKKMLSDSKNGIPLSRISQQVEKILLSKKPKFRYKIGRLTKALTIINLILPERWFERSVLQSFGIPLTIQY